MIWLAACTVLFSGVKSPPAETPPTTTVILVVGEPGETKYEELFLLWGNRWREAVEKTESDFVMIGPPAAESADRNDRDRLMEKLAALETKTPETLWLVFIGHGTFDGKKAKFNLRGNDIIATELADLLSPLSCRTAIINCASSSGPFINRLSGPNRVVISATQSGFEYNFARFGDYLSQTIGDSSADLDKDGQTSLLEAWLVAAKQTQEHYDSQSQLATEHSLLDDNGDGKGTPSDWFRGIHLNKTSKDDRLPDGTLAKQFILVPGEDAVSLTDDLRQKRDQLELELAALRRQKDKLPEAEYLDRLEKLLVPLARIYREAETKSK